VPVLFGETVTACAVTETASPWPEVVADHAARAISTPVTAVATAAIAASQRFFVSRCMSVPWRSS
jgi:hypothetical protein